MSIRLAIENDTDPTTLKDHDLIARRHDINDQIARLLQRRDQVDQELLRRVRHRLDAIREQPQRSLVTIGWADDSHEYRAEFTRTVVWDQDVLLEIADRLHQAGHREIEDYLSATYAITEHDFARMSQALQDSVRAARAVHYGPETLVVSKRESSNGFVGKRKNGKSAAAALVDNSRRGGNGKDNAGGADAAPDIPLT